VKIKAIAVLADKQNPTRCHIDINWELTITLELWMRTGFQAARDGEIEIRAVIAELRAINIKSKLKKNLYMEQPFILKTSCVLTRL